MENSTFQQNYEIAEAFVKTNVYGCVTPLLDYILNRSLSDADAPVGWDDILNYYYYEDDRGNKYTDEQRERVIAELKDQMDALGETEREKIAELTAQIENLEFAETKSWEIYEWWLVSEFLGHKLERLGEVVLRDGISTYWGRCTTGQPIALDGIMGKICAEMEILVGQTHGWKVPKPR